eukprot:2226327-Prymnesium_polylepis.1
MFTTDAEVVMPCTIEPARQAGPAEDIVVRPFLLSAAPLAERSAISRRPQLALRDGRRRTGAPRR